MNDESWEQFFNILYEGIMADSIYIKDRGNYIKIAIEGYFNGEPITFQFRLFSVEYPESKVVNFMIGMTRKIQEYQKSKKLQWGNKQALKVIFGYARKIPFGRPEY